MFGWLKNLVASRLGHGMVLDDFVHDDEFFIKIPAPRLYTVAFFLKNDPDVRLTLLDQIIVLPKNILSWSNHVNDHKGSHQIIYQMRSIKLPYRVSLVVDIEHGLTLQSIAHLYAGARFYEEDMRKTWGFSIDEEDREIAR